MKVTGKIHNVGALRVGREKFKSKDQKVFGVLVLVYCLNVILFIMPFTALLFPIYWLYWFLLLSIKTLIEIAFALPVAKFFKQKFLHQAKDFYDKNGGFAVIVARFVPFIRTFAPIVAGIVEMDKKKYFFYNVVGCFAWVITMICAGYFLNKAFPILQTKLELIVIVIVLVSTLPIIYKMIQAKKEKKKNAGI